MFKIIASIPTPLPMLWTIDRGFGNFVKNLICLAICLPLNMVALIGFALGLTYLSIAVTEFILLNPVLSATAIVSLMIGVALGFFAASFKS